MTTTTSRFDRGARHRDDRRQAGHTVYPALAAWWKRVGDTPPIRWTYDNLWRAAMAEMEASETCNHPEREQQLQREALALLLGEPLYKTRLTRDTMRSYLQALATYEQKGPA